MLGLIAAAWAGWGGDVAEPPREYRGAWVATVANIDWPSKPGLPAEALKAEADAIVAKASALRLNMLILQVRTSADALYESGLEPSSWFLTGKQGAKLAFDPLEYWIAQCHSRGIELHAWINPFRAGHPAQKGPFAASHVSGTSSNVRTYGKYRWMDPACPELRRQTLDVVTDLVRRYDLDGLHMDDYFYPYPEAGAGDFPDGALYQAYKASGGGLGKRAWRRANVDSLVREIGKRVAATKPWVRFGISPFGIFRPGEPPVAKAGIDQYEDLGADAKKWLREAWCDNMVPQLYWKRSAPGQPFEPLLEWWMGENSRGIPLLAGLFTSQCDPKAGAWPASEIAAKIEIARKKKAAGTVHFSMKALMKDWNGVAQAVAKLNAERALPPPHPRAPAGPGPSLDAVGKAGSGVRWVVWEDSGRWRVSEPGDPAWRKAATARTFDRFGRLGPPGRPARG